jgi:hypothetical protein
MVLGSSSAMASLYVRLHVLSIRRPHDGPIQVDQ